MSFPRQVCRPSSFFRVRPWVSLAANFIQLPSGGIVTQYVNTTLFLAGRSAEPLGKAWWGSVPNPEGSGAVGGRIACLQLLPLGLLHGEPAGFQPHSTCRGAWPQGTQPELGRQSVIRNSLWLLIKDSPIGKVQRTLASCPQGDPSVPSI